MMRRLAMSSNQYGGYGPQGGYPQGGYPQGAPPGMGMPPNMQIPGGKPAGQSGCSGCLVGCVVATGISIAVFAGLLWFGYSWVRDNLLDKQPLAVKVQPITDQDMVRMAPALMLLQENTGEQMKLTITPAEANYLVMAALMQSVAATSESQLKIPTAEELNSKNVKLSIDFPDDGKVDFAFSVPIVGNGLYFNLQGSSEFEINDGKPAVKIIQAKIGKYVIKGQLADTFSREIMNQFPINPELQKFLQHVPELKIKKGAAHIKLAANPSTEAPAEVPAEAPASQ